MTNHLTVRQLEPTDAPVLLAFYEQLPGWITHWFEPFPQRDNPQMLHHLAEAAAHRAISMGLVTDEGAVVGHGFVLGLDTQTPTFGIGLDEQWIGGGWGWRLMKAVLAYEWAGLQNLVMLMMDCPDKIARALILMEAQEEPILDAVCALAPPLIHFPDNLSSDNLTGYYDAHMRDRHRQRFVLGVADQVPPDGNIDMVRRIATMVRQPGGN